MKLYKSLFIRTLNIKLLVLILASLMSYSVIANCYYECPQQSAPKKTQPNYYNGSCPCFQSVAAIRDAIGDSPMPRSCVSNNDYSLLTDGPFTYTIQEHGNLFSCFYRNINTSEKEEFVEYGSQDEVQAMQTACDKVLRSFARQYKIPCQ